MSVYQSKEVTKDGRSWFYKVYYQNSKSEKKKPTISKKFKTKSDAINAEQKYLLILEKNKQVPINLTFKELYDTYLEIHGRTVKDSTYRGYLNMTKHIKCFFKLKCLGINYQHFEKWKSSIDSLPLSTKTKNSILKHFKAVLNFGSDYYGFNFNSLYRKMKKFKNKDEIKKEMKYYTLDEFNKFISVESDKKLYALWETLFFCGLRCGEARGLVWSNINFEKHNLCIKQTVSPSYRDKTKPYLISTPKTKTSIRIIPICDRLYKTFLNYKNYLVGINEYNPSGFVFGDKFGTVPFDPEYIRIAKDDNADYANIKKIRLHDFRHSCASLLINNGGNVTLVAKYLGHSEIRETLNTYSHLFPDALDDVIKIINETTNES